jgi:hypothetical protein
VVYVLGRSEPNIFQIQPNPAKPAQIEARKSKKNSLDFLGFFSAKRAFSMTCADPRAKNLFLAFDRAPTAGARRTMGAHRGSLAIDVAIARRP